MAEQQVVLPDGWSRPPGWSHGVILPAGARLIEVAGQFGWDPVSQKCSSDTFAGQWQQALSNVRAVVEAAGASVTSISSMRVYVTSLAQYREGGSDLGKAWMAVIGKHFPAMTLVEVSGLTDPDALVEIEAVAHLEGR